MDLKSSQLSRRSFIGAAAGGALALALPPGLRSGLAAADPRSFAGANFKRALPIPDVLTGDQIAIRMEEADIPVLSGQPTRMWTFNGQFPGPTIRRAAGSPTQVTFTHELPEDVGELTVHLHGGHTSANDDGYPGGLTQSQPKSLYCDVPKTLSKRGPGNDVLIYPGGERTYSYELMEDGKPERSAFQWYHDHRLDRTARNVWHGLAGMFIIDDEFDSDLPLPTGDRDIPLMIVDRSFKSNNQLKDPFDGFGHAPNDGINGELVLVNGAHKPFHRVDGAKYRLRFLNASQFRSYRLHLSHGLHFTQIATESGLIPKPIERSGIIIGPAERVEVVVDFADAAGKDVVLYSIPREPGHPDGTGSKTFDGPLMQFRVGGRKQDSARVPNRLRPLPLWIHQASKRPDRHFVFKIGNGFPTPWVINGKTFNPDRSDAFPVIDTVETWQVTNGSSVAHLAHFHGSDWYMVKRNGRKPPPYEHNLKETFFLDPGESVTIATKFTDHLGKFVFHCHMLDHEDHGLMSQFEVVEDTAKAAGQGETAPLVSGDGAADLGLPEGVAETGMLEFTPRAPTGKRLHSLELRIDGRRARTLRGKSTRQPVRLAVPVGRDFRVTVVAKTEDGKYLGAARDYSG
jgi:FtsP/CotA-like multicopper oxidase with cupredoxin domain